MNRIFWDTNLFIYLWGGREPWCGRVETLWRAMRERGDELLTSTLTLGELLAQPLAAGAVELARRMDGALGEMAQLIPLDAAAARIYAELRGDRGLKAPDAVQLACAGAARTDLFITNDRRLQGRKVRGVRFVTALEDAPY